MYNIAPAAAGAIAIVNYDFRASGTVAKSIQIATAVRRVGLPAELWVVRDQGPLRSRVPASIPVVQAGAAVRVPSRIGDLALSVPAFARELRRRRPAALLSAGNHFHLAARTALLLSGLRSQVRLGLRISNSSRHDPAARSVPTGPLTRLKYAGADFLTAVSADLAAEVAAVVPGREVGCIPNGCDLAQVRRMAQEPVQHRFLDEGAVVITAMGRLARQKGFDILIESLALLRREVDARLIIVGNGPRSELAALQKLAVQRGVVDAVDFTGYLSNPFSLIARSQLFVCSSRWEGASNSLLEALACNVPLVATDCPTGNGEILMHGQLGALAMPESPSALAAAMQRELTTSRAADVRARQLARMDIDRCLASWCELLAREYRLAGTQHAHAHARNATG